MVLLTDIVSAKNTVPKYSEKNHQNASILVFIDAGVESPQFLAQGVVPGAKAFILDRNKDGIKQITEILKDYATVDSIHLVSHGSPGSLQLGNTHLSLDTLDSYQSQLKTWFSSRLPVSSSPNLLVYGCNVAAGDAGEEFVNRLHQITGADIAASKTKVGNSEKNGSWILNSFQTRKTQNLAFSAETLESYPGVFEGLVYRTGINGITLPFEVYDPGTNTWTSLGNVDTETQLATDANGELYMLNSTTNMIQKYVPADNTWIDIQAGPPESIRLGNLEVTNNGDFVVTEYGNNKMYYTDAGEWEQFVLPSNASQAGDYDHATETLIIRQIGSETVWEIDLDTSNVTTFNVGTGVVGENNRFGDIYDGFWYGQTGNTNISKIDLSDNSLSLQALNSGIPFQIGASTVDNASGVFYVNKDHFSGDFFKWDATTGISTTLTTAPSPNNHSTLAFTGAIVLNAEAENDISSIDEDSVLNIETPGVLDNDTGDAIVVTESDDVSANGATVVVNEDGSYDYDPTTSETIQALAAGETLEDTFAYTIQDSNEVTAEATVTVTVTGVNDAPINNIPETLEVDEDDTLSFTGESAISIADPDGDLQSTTLSLNDGILSVDEIESLTIDGNDSETLRLTGSQEDINAALATLEYTPNEDFNGNDLLSILSNDAAGEFDADFKLIDVASVNDAPTLEMPVGEQLEEGDNVAIEDAPTPFSLTLDEGTFADLRDPEDTLTYSAMVEGGEAGVFEPLPEDGWLEFDAENLTFSGTPENDDVGEYQIKVVATDSGESIAEGEELTAEDTFTLTVENTNDAPTVTNTFYDQLQSDTTGVDGAIFTGSDASLNPDETTSYTHNFNLREEREFSITLPEDAFNDVDVDDELVYTATLSNGDPLPEGFSFDPDTLTLSGNPDDDAVREGSYEVLVTATDLTGESVSESIVLEIENFNDAPILDLNGLDEPSKNFVALGVTPSSNLTSVVDRDLSLTDVDNDTLNAATVQIANPSNGFSESLTADTQGTNIQRTYDANRGILYLIGEDSVENYQDVLRTVQYDNSFDSGINRELILEFGVWDFPEFDYPSFEYPYFGFAENPFNEDFYDFNPDIDNIDLGDETEEFPFPEYQVASAISYTQFETDTTIGFEGGEGDYLVIADTDGGDTDDEFAISLDADNNTLVVNTNSDFSISDGYSSYLEEQLSNEQFSENIKGIGLGEGYYGYWSKPPIQAINGQTEIDFDAIYYGVDIDSMDGEDSISVDVSDLDLMESYMGSNLYLDIEDESFSGKFSEEMVETEEVMPTNELELKGTLDSGESFDRLNHYFEMDYGVYIYAEHDNPDMEDDYYSSHDSVNISYATGSMKTVVDELDVNERVYEFEGYEGVVVTIDDNEVEDDGKSMISSDLSSESIIFSNPNDALHVETYEGDDLVNVDGIDNDFIADFVINTYDGDDIINGGASDEIIIGGAGKDILTGGVGSDTFVLNELSESLAVPGFAFDVITDLEIGSDAIVAPVAISAENITDFGVLSEFSPSAATAFLAELDADSAAILEFASKDFLVINDGIAEFDVFADAVIEITGYTGNLDDLAIGSVNDLGMDDSNNLPA